MATIHTIMRKQIWAIVAVAALFFSLGSCATAPVVDSGPQGTTVETAPAPETPPVEAPPAPEPAEPEPQPEPEPEPTVIEISEELYDRTFDEVEAVISELNAIVRNKDFQSWTSYLTERYVTYYSNPAVLEQQSKRPILEQNNVQLLTLNDYFEHVFVPSRANLRLDDMVFLEADTVEAIMIIQDQRYVLYLLKQVDDRWKIDTF